MLVTGWREHRNVRVLVPGSRENMIIEACGWVAGE